MAYMMKRFAAKTTEVRFPDGQTQDLGATSVARLKEINPKAGSAISAV